MARRKKSSTSSPQNAPEPHHLLIPLPGGKRVALIVTPEEEKILLTIVAAYQREIAALERKLKASRVMHRPSTDRFERGVLLVLWIKNEGKGRLIKELLNNLIRHNRDWPEVRAFQTHKSRDKLRKALQNLAEDTRQQIREGRLPESWQQD